MNIPSNLKYTASDEWVLIEGNIATVGVSDFAQNQLSDIVYVEITTEVGAKISKNSACATLESVKAAADVNVPISGTVKEVNEDLSGSPDAINTKPYESWMVKIDMSDTSELKSLMDVDAYKKYCEERSH